MKNLLTICLFLVLPLTVFAQTTGIYDGDIIEISTEVGLGYKTGTTHEIVYDDNSPTGDIYHLSQLDWSQDVLMVGGSLTLSSLDLISITGSAWTSIGNNKGTMEDYDWLGYYYPYNMAVSDPTDWTHYSLSTTEMNHQMYDIGLSLFAPKIDKILTIGAIVGFHAETWSWVDNLQNLTYSTGGVGGFRDYYHEFPDNTHAVNYSVTMDLLYVGASFNIEDDWFLMNFYGKYSRWGNISTIDNHLLRGLTIVETFENVKYLELGGGVGCNLNDNLSLNFGFTYFIIPEVVGSEIVQDGESFKEYANSVGYAQESFMIDFVIRLTY